MSMDREKKIAEIREALEKATPRWHYNGNEIVSLDNPRVGIGGFLRDENNYLAANAPEWFGFLLDELERLEQERNKLIEALRWYADEENQKLDESTRHWENVYSPYEMDGGQRAREILKEIGVKVE